MNLTAWLPFWNSLDDVRRIHSGLELGAIVFFLLLALFDALAHWTKNKEKEHDFGAIGIVFFFLAVTCELFGYAYGQRNDTLSENVIVSLSKTAGQAAIDAGQAVSDSKIAVTNSGTAGTNAGIAKSTADAAKLTAGSAKKEADAADEKMAVLEHRLADLNGDVEAQEPRAKLLAKSEAEILKKLSPFAGQKVAVESCGLVVAPGRDRREVFDTWGQLIHLLSKSKWKHEIGAPVDWAACNEMPGVTIWANPYGAVDTINASKALDQALSSVLPTRRGVDRPVLIGSGIPMDDPQAPWVWTSKHPDFIVVLVSEQPQAESIPTPRKQ